MPRTIVVLSPHLDDAALCCCDHIREWIGRGDEVTVASVFTSNKSEVVPDYLKESMDRIGTATVEALEQMRIKEDMSAMRLLGASWLHMGYVDGGFRAHEGSAIYPDFPDLISGRMSAHDAPLLDDLAAAFERWASHGLILAPLGVGQHQDHLLVRRAAERCFEPARLARYLDHPYARNPMRWKLGQVIEAARARKSFKWITDEKRKILACYASQMPYLFRWKPRYPEVILGPPA